MSGFVASLRSFRRRRIDIPVGPDALVLDVGSGDKPHWRADVLLVTWTVDEGHALSRVLTPGKDSRDDYLPYTHNFAAIAAKMRKICPAVQAGRLGTFWTTRIGGKWNGGLTPGVHVTS